MVALNTAYAAPKNAADPQNRVGDFFYEDRASVGKNRWASRLNTQEKSCYHYEAASGRSNWLSRDPLEYNLGLDAEFLPEGPNLYSYVGNNPINYIDEEGDLAVNAVGAGIGAGISFGTQFAANGGFNALWNGDWGKAWQATKCVDYADVGISAGMGALGLSVGKNAFQAAKGLHSANKARRGRHLTNYLKEEAVENAVNEVKEGAAKGIGATLLNKSKDHIDAVPGNNCK